MESEDSLVWHTSFQWQSSLDVLPRTLETAVTTAANVGLPTDDKTDDISLAPRPRLPRGGDVTVRTRPSHSARNSQIITVQTGSHQSIRVPVRPGQVIRVSSTRASRVEQTSSPIPICGAVGQTSRILASDGYDDKHLHPSRSPPVVRT